MKFTQLPLGLLPALALMLLTQLVSAQEKRILVHNQGSDSMTIAVIAWTEAFQRTRRHRGISVSGGGSGTGIAALTNGTVSIANASRPMTNMEIERAAKHDINPVEHFVGRDAVALFVHKNNLIDSITLEQLNGIFARGGKTEKWTDLGIEVAGCEDQKIIRVSRQSSSGTHSFVRKQLLGGGRFKLGTLQSHSSKDIVELIEKTPCAIGYSSYAYGSSEVKTLCIAEEDGGPCIYPSIAAVSDASYPLSRPLFMYTNGEPQGVVKEYIDWVLDDEGQCILLQKQYAPIRKVTCGG